MSITGAIVSYAVLWFVCLFLVLSRGISTQMEEGEVEPGTPGGAPSNIRIGRKFLWATVLAFIPLGAFAAILHWDLITMDDLSFMMPGSLKDAR